MSHQSPHDDWHSDEYGKCPIRPRWQLVERGELLPVIDIEGDQHEHVRRSHACNVEWLPTMRSPATSCATDERGEERERAEQEQMIGMFPSHDAQGRSRQEQCGEQPEVQRAKARVSAWSLRA